MSNFFFQYNDSSFTSDSFFISGFLFFLLLSSPCSLPFVTSPSLALSVKSGFPFFLRLSSCSLPFVTSLPLSLSVTSSFLFFPPLSSRFSLVITSRFSPTDSFFTSPSLSLSLSVTSHFLFFLHLPSHFSASSFSLVITSHFSPTDSFFTSRFFFFLRFLSSC